MGARVVEERAGLSSPDLRHFVPTSVAPGSAHGTLGRAQVQATRGLDGRGGQRRGREALPTVGGGAHALRQQQPRVSFARPPLFVDLVLPFGLEDEHRGLSQVDRPALEVADHDLVAAARAPSRVIGRRVEGDAAVRACDRDDGLWRGRQHGRRHRLRQLVERRLGTVKAKKPPKKPDRNHLGSLAPAGRSDVDAADGAIRARVLPAPRSGYSGSRPCRRSGLASPTTAWTSPTALLASAPPPAAATIRSRLDDARASCGGSGGTPGGPHHAPCCRAYSRGVADAASSTLKQDGARP